MPGKCFKETEDVRGTTLIKTDEGDGSMRRMRSSQMTWCVPKVCTVKEESLLDLLGRFRQIHSIGGGSTWKHESNRRTVEVVNTLNVEFGRLKSN